MSEKEIGRALLNVENSAAEMRPAGEIADQIFKRDRLRLRILAGVSTCFWAVTVAGVIWLIVFYFMFIVPRLEAYAAGRLRLENDWAQWIRAFDAGAEIVLTSIIAFFLAALGTMWLVFSSRHATLRQIQADLAQISEQLKRLHLPDSPRREEVRR